MGALASASKPSTAAINSINVFGSERGSAAQPTSTAQPATSGSVGGAGNASVTRTDSKGKSGASGVADGVTGDSSWFLVKCLPLEMDDYHHGASQVLCEQRKQGREHKVTGFSCEGG